MIKKFTAALCAAAVLFSANAYAQSEINIERIGFSPVARSLTVSGTCSETKDKLWILEQITDENGAVTAAEQSQVTDGRFYFEKYLLPDNLKVGEYTIVVSLMSGENVTAENAFYYGGSVKAAEILNAVNQSTSTDEIDDIINQNYKSLGFSDYDIYVKCTSKKQLLKDLLDMDFAADASNVAEKWQSLLDILSKNTLLTYFSDTTSPEDIKMLVENTEYLDAMGMEQNDTYKKLTDEGKNAAYAIIAADSGDTADDINLMFKKGCLLAFLRNSRYTEVETALRENSDIAEVDYSVYNTLSAEKKNAVMNKTSVYAQTENDIDRICDYFESEARNQAKSGGAGSGGSSGGGSGSGGSSGGYVYGGGTSTSVSTGETISGTAVSFTDLETVPWAYEAVTALANKGVLSGMGDGTFAPNEYVTRAQFCKMICTCFGIEADGNAEFTDVSKESWYYSYVTNLANAGVINGVGDGRFDPDGLITRQDIAVILARVISKMNYAIPKDNATQIFADDNDIADYAKSSMYELFACGILTGTDGKAMPCENATRAEAATLIYRTEVARWQSE